VNAAAQYLNMEWDTKKTTFQWRCSECIQWWTSRGRADSWVLSMNLNQFHRLPFWPPVNHSLTATAFFILPQMKNPLISFAVNAWCFSAASEGSIQIMSLILYSKFLHSIFFRDLTVKFTLAGFLM
jgi:hypothetical protein